MKTKRTFAFGASLATGAAIWALSPALTGEVEPWDANTVFLPIAIVIVSLILGFLFPKNPLVSSAGLLLGQVTYILILLPIGPLILVGLVFLLGYVIVFSLPFTFLAAFIHRKFRRSVKSSDD